MFKKKTMKREEITASSNAGHHINFSITDTDDTILIQIIDVSHKTIIEESKFNEVKAK